MRNGKQLIICPISQIISKATQVLSGSKYPTISLVLLFKAEITGVLTDLATDSNIVKPMKHKMRMVLNHRLPVKDLHVIATMLDPSQRALTTVQKYLNDQNNIAVEFLKQAVQKSQNDQTSRDETAEKIPRKRTKYDTLMKLASSATLSLERNIQQYRCLTVSPNDLLAW